MLIKVCGLTDAKIAAQCVLHGSDYIGLLFSDKSIRKIDLAKATQITQAVRNVGGEVVAVFVDEEYEDILHIIKHLDLKIIQLHGDKVREYVDRFDPTMQIIYVIDKDIPIPTCLKPSRDYLLFEKVLPPQDLEFRFFIAGRLNHENVQDVIKQTKPYGVDLSGSLESSPAVKDIGLVKQFIKTVRPERFGRFGGRYVPELLIPPLQELEVAYNSIAKTVAFRDELYDILKNHIGRPTPLTEVKNFANEIGAKFRIFLKREDLLHTGAHKINNALGQCLLAKKMGKTRIVAETGAGQHGVATATACAMFGLECIVYMGAIDIERQAPNVAKMRLLGATVVSVTSGTATLKDAVNDALRDWAHSYQNTHYCLGSALGPHPFPTMVADFHRVIGTEAREQLHTQYGLTANKVVACVGGGSNAIGIFGAFIDDSDVELIGVEAGGHGYGLGNNAARFSEGSPGVLHGSYTYLLQDDKRQIVDTYSISAGLDYAAVGPEHAYLKSLGRANYTMATDKEALSAFLTLIKTEGIIPALESSHALSYVITHRDDIQAGEIVVINLSGRGDKDLPSLLSKELSHV